jgi:hypothetical protein
VHGAQLLRLLRLPFQFRAQLRLPLRRRRRLALVEAHRSLRELRRELRRVLLGFLKALTFPLRLRRSQLSGGFGAERLEARFRLGECRGVLRPQPLALRLQRPRLDVCVGARPVGVVSRLGPRFGASDAKLRAVPVAHLAHVRTPRRIDSHRARRRRPPQELQHH